MFATLFFSILLIDPDSTVVNDGTVSVFDKTFDEIVVNGTSQEQQLQAGKGVQSIDEHLDRLGKVDLVKRGAYAWEASVNSMQTERVSTTIDGMKIFCACTDKMDPVTSYVETSNLSRIALNSGLGNDPQATGNLGGSLDLKLRKCGFDAAPHEVNVQTGYESNGQLQSYLADVAFSSHRLYLNAGGSYRKAQNYEAGGGREVHFSQFAKYNLFANGGWQVSDANIVEGTVIYDRASDVGYPSLTMDVKKAEGFITALSYRKERWELPFLTRWESKLYYNNISHEMDDTHRPDVVMHMDMPGLSRTAGFYSLLVGRFGDHQWLANFDGYSNRSRAEMTMYPTTYGTPAYNPADRMFMLTWPDVRTTNTGLSLSDQWGPLRLSVKGALQWSRISDDEGYSALRIYYPGLLRQKQRLEGRIALHYQKQWQAWKLEAGAGWGSRTPTVTEAYGYFLYNTLDGFDYLGNPTLKNEKAVELDLSLTWKWAEKIVASADGNLFLFRDYILGEVTDATLQYASMTVGAAGVKQYTNLPHATVANASFRLEWKWTEAWKWQNQVTYAFGEDNENRPLPLIAPWQWKSAVTYEWGQWEGELSFRTAARRTRVAESLGESRTPGYGCLNLQAGYLFQVAGKVNCTAKAGIENLFDKYYTTYADWNGIARKGRNFFASLQVSF